MIRNYLKIALRNLQRNKIYSLINITGLTVGLTACLLVATVVLDDLSYDRQWKNADHIYRIVSIDKNSKNAIERSSYSFTGLGPNFKKLFPEVKEYCRMTAGKTRFKMGADKDGVQLTTISAEPSIWKVLNFDIVAGNPVYYQKGYKNLVITQKIKCEYFHDTDPIGKVITNIPQFGKPSNYIITGIIKDITANTTLRAEVLEISANNPDFDVLHKEAYGSFAEQYLLFQPQASISTFEAKANKWLNGYFTNKEFKYSFTLQNIKDIYLRSTDLSGIPAVSGDIRNVYIFSGVAALLLLIACINFVNLTTARALKRIKEAGIRKVLGAEKRELVAQFLFESLLFFLISFIAGMVLYTIMLKPVETYLGYPLTLTLQSNFLLLSVTTGFVLLVSLLTGIYPAMLISAQNPVATIKGKISAGIGSNMLRKGLVVAQFTISVAVLIVTIVVQSQLRYMDMKDLGFNQSNLLDIKQMSWDGKANVFKQQVLGITGVEKATLTTWAPGSGSGGYMSMEAGNPKDKNDRLKIWYINADFDFVKTLGFRLEKGRLLDPQRSTDAINTDSLMAKNIVALDSAQRVQPMLMTSLAARTFEVKELDKPVWGIQGIPVGVINDFNNESLKIDMKPVFIRAMRNVAYGNMLIRVRPGSEKQVLNGLYGLWQKTFPDKVFQYDWSDEVLKSQYKAEHKLQQLFTLFSFLILSLAALGLFGLTMFIAELRVKEIGIRKVLGASVSIISMTLSKDFIKLVFVAIIIASPVAWYFGNKWLQNYSYRISIHWWIFVLSGLMAVIIAVLTISYQTIKAALANPVKSLRSE
jgi:putative ABC transport system permease protein